MTLRGHGSLQEVIGRTNQYRKRKTQASSSDNEHNLVQSSIYKPTTTSAAPQQQDKAADKKPRLLQRKLQLQPPPTSHTPGPSCPVCGETLTTNNHALNQHIAPGTRTAPAQATSPTPWHSIGLCPIVSRHRASHTPAPPPGTAITAMPEPTNPHHAHALCCMHDDAAVGYLPMAVANALAPALAAGLLQGVRLILKGGADGPGNSQLVGMLQALRAVGGGAHDVQGPLQQAAKAASDALQGRTQRRVAYIELVLEVIRTVLRDDAPIFPDQLHCVLTQLLQDCSLPQQHLLLRLWARRGPWFRVGALRYDEVPDATATASALCAAGLLTSVGAPLTVPNPHTNPHHNPHAVCATGPPVKVGGEDNEKSESSPVQGGACVSVAHASNDARVQLAEVVQVLTVPELAQLAAVLGCDATGGRDALLDNVRGAIRHRHTPAQALESVSAAVGFCVRLDATLHEALRRVERCHFLNEGQGFANLNAAQLGAVRYPSYRVLVEHRVFPTLEHYEAYTTALAHACALDDVLQAPRPAAADLEAALAPAWAALGAGAHKRLGTLPPGSPLLRFSAGWVYSLMATTGVAHLEKQRRYKEAVERLQQLLGGVMCPSRRGDWWFRLSVDMEHLGQVDTALELAETALADERLLAGDRLALQRRVLRLGKPPRRWKTPPWAAAALWEPPESVIEGRPLNSVTGIKSQFYGWDNAQCSVEEFALQHYAMPEQGGWSGLHSEGGIWATLFGLLFWDVIFADAPDALRTPFQTAPLDLHTAAFYAARQDLVDARLQELHAGAAHDLLASAWHAHHGVLCRGVNWERHPLAELQGIARACGGGMLAAVCGLLAKEDVGGTGGMPDLLLFRHSPAPSAKMVEVKGPRDRLSEAQRAWMRALQHAGVAVEVCKVLEPEAAQRRQKPGARRRGV